MITPRFTADQSDDFITLIIDAPYVKFSVGEMVLAGTEFTFYCKPYFLKLHFSGEIVENGQEFASYCIDKHQFTIKLPKLNSGEYFQNLDMLTSLMCPKPKLQTSNPLVEVISSTEASGNSKTDNSSGSSNLSPTVQKQDHPVITSDSIDCITLHNQATSYGFSKKTHGLFRDRPEESAELVDIPDPDSLTLDERRQLQWELENRDFSPDHYLADLIEDEQILELVNQELPFSSGTSLSNVVQQLNTLI